MTLFVQARITTADHQVSCLPQLDFSQFFQTDIARLESIINVMIIIGNLIGQIDNLRFERRSPARIKCRFCQRTRLVVIRGMLDNSFAGLPTEIETIKIRIAVLKDVDYSQRLTVMLKSTVILHQSVEDRLSSVTKRRMTQIVGEGQSFYQIFIKLQGPGDAACNLGNLK